MGLATAADLAIVRTVERDKAAGRIKPGDAELGEQAKERLEDTYRRLAELSPAEYDFERVGAADSLGISPSALDREIKGRRPKADGKGHEVEFEEPQPWAHPVDGAAVLNELAGVINRYVVMPADSAVACALWVLHTYAHDAARVSPILAVTSPEKRCGKTTLLEVLGALVTRALPGSSITAPALFRAVEKYRPTLLIDEADTFLRGSDELRGILNSGHRRRSACVIRTVGDDHEPRQFRTWAPKAIALIGKLPPTLADRSVPIALRRRAPSEAVERWRDESFSELCGKVARWAKDNADALNSARPELPEGLHDRALDNWEPLFAIADAAGGNWPTKARNAAASLSGELNDDSVGTMLLTDIRGLFDRFGADRLTSQNLCEQLGAMEARPWPEWGKAQKQITPRQLARILEPFGIRPKQGREGEKNWRGYALADFKEAFSRYLPSESATPLHPATTGGYSYSVPATPRVGVAEGKAPKPARDGACSVVAEREVAERVGEL